MNNDDYRHASDDYRHASDDHRRAGDPYFREDPGTGIQRIKIYEFEMEKGYNTWRPWRTNDGRILSNSDSGFCLIDNPFGTGGLLMLSTCYDPSISGRVFGGFGMRTPIHPSVNLNKDTFIEFDFYYPKSAADKYRKFEIWSTSTGGEGSQADFGYAGSNKSSIYIRTSDLEGVYIFNLDYRCGFYNNETWFKQSVHTPVPVNAGVWEYLNIDLHTEMNAKLADDLLMIGNIRITQLDPNGVPIPAVVNEKKYSDVAPLKEKFNPANGYFLIGTDGKETVSSDNLSGYHYDIFVDHRNLKPERHLRPPKWLKDRYPDFEFQPSDEGPEWDLPTEYYRDLRDKGFKSHGHCLAWINQSPHWMMQIIPETITNNIWTPNGFFYSKGYIDSGPFIKVNKNTARRIQFNHIMDELRHFMTTDSRYNSSKERGIIPFHSFDVVNAGFHESWHSITSEWKSALANVSWLVAMTDDDFDIINQHYIYLLYKYAHIAIPNKQMAQKFKEGYSDSNIVPEYMKQDGHDKNGSIDDYITETPPFLNFIDHEFTIDSKVRAAYNMIKAINTAWKNDPLYDGRNLIECIGIKGHDSVNPNLASQKQKAMKVFADLIDRDLLDYICVSEMDMKMPESAPGGKAFAPDVLNQKQADTLGYQYALLFKLFEKYRKYVDHVIIWDQFGSGWMNSYVPFDHEQNASQIYYAMMDPDRFIQGHSYLDGYFKGEYEKIR